MKHIYVGNHTGRISSSDNDFAQNYFNQCLQFYGYAIGETNPSDRSWNHRVIGVGVGHDDAAFAEVGDSMAAYYENGQAFWSRHPRKATEDAS